MEMDIGKLDLDRLPPGERTFIDLVASSMFLAYGAGFRAEWATLAHLGHHFMHLNEFANIALMRVGSGGRFEGAALGEAEFVLLTKDSMGDGWVPPVDGEFGTRIYPAAYYQTLCDTTGSDIVGVGVTPYMEVRLEHKRLDGEEPLSYYSGVDVPFPGRIIEGEYVAGNVALVTEARRRVFTEMATEPKILAGIKKDLKTYRKVCETGLSRKLPQFSLEDDVLFFDPPKRQFGMKYGLLRYVQTALLVEFIELFQRKQLPVDEYLDLPQSVEERIRYAFRKNWVANEKDFIIAGHIYLQATELNSTAKIQYYTDATKTVFPVEPGAPRMAHKDILDIFDTRLLIE